MNPRAAGLLLGFAADRLLGDPARFHPVAGFGTIGLRLERRLYADDRRHGALYVVILVGSVAAAGFAAEYRLRRSPALHLAATAAATWTVLGGTSLDREAAAVEALLAADRLPEARLRLSRFVGRDTGGLDETAVARATIESVAENTSDAVVAPLVLGALAGLPGLLGYRAANTLDAMVGHRSPRYRRFGWAAARLDDVLNLPGARLTALCAAGLAGTVDGSTRAAIGTWRRDAGKHPSPNSGQAEAAFAGALGVSLGGRTVYAGRIEDRPVLGRGPGPGRHDISRARALAARADLAAVAIAAALAGSGAGLSIGRRPRRRPLRPS